MDLQARSRSRVIVLDFNKFSGKAQVRRATLSCDSSYFSIILEHSMGSSRTVQAGKQICIFVSLLISSKQAFSK